MVGSVGVLLALQPLHAVGFVEVAVEDVEARSVLIAPRFRLSIFRENCKNLVGRLFSCAGFRGARGLGRRREGLLDFGGSLVSLVGGERCDAEGYEVEGISRGVVEGGEQVFVVRDREQVALVVAVGERNGRVNAKNLANVVLEGGILSRHLVDLVNLRVSLSWPLRAM